MNFKDAPLSWVLKKLANHHLKRIGGEVLEFRIDSENKTLYLKVFLKGEEKPLEVEAKAYAIESIGGQSFIRFENLTTSREWVNAVLELYFEDKKLPVPEKYVKLIKMII